MADLPPGKAQDAPTGKHQVVLANSIALKGLSAAVKAKSVTFDRQPVIGVAKVDPVLMASRNHPELQDRFW
jgi:hypothetical protein